MYSKISTYLFFILFIFIFISTEHGRAQNSAYISSPDLKSIYGSTKWYQPSLNFWDQNQFIRSWEDRPGGSLNVSVGATFDAGLPVEPHLAIGFWRDQAQQSAVATIGGFGTRSFTVSMIPFTLGVSYSIDALSWWNVTPLLEAGGSLRWIQQRYEFDPATNGASPVDQSDGGWTSTANLAVGARRPVLGQILQLHLGYVFGSYRTLVPTGDGTGRERTVSLSGPQIGLTVSVGL